jgi:hypothetical protein
MKELMLAANPLLSGFERTATEQTAESLRQALRVLELVPIAATELIPHPLIVVRSEIENARRYLSLIGNASMAKSEMRAEYTMASD